MEGEREEDMKRPRLTRDFKPFDYEGSKFTEFTKGQSSLQPIYSQPLNPVS